MHDYFSVKPTKFKNHPCPKPTKWAEWLIKRSTNKCDIILDPFVGSGTSCVAAKKLNRHFIGIEISPKYCKIAKHRLANIPKTKLEDYA